MTGRADNTQVKTRLEEWVRDERFGEGHEFLIRIINKWYLLGFETYYNLSKFRLIYFFLSIRIVKKIQLQKSGWINLRSVFLQQDYVSHNGVYLQFILTQIRNILSSSEETISDAYYSEALLTNMMVFHILDFNMILIYHTYFFSIKKWNWISL